MANTRVKCDVEGLVAEINQLGERAVRGVSTEMLNYGELMLHQAKLNAPRDTGSLEDALDIELERGGINGRLVVRIYVDLSAAYVPTSINHKPTDKSVGDYAEMIERHLAPYGSGKFQAGEGTLAKGRQAGGRFLSRAAEKYRKELISKARQIVVRSVQRRG